MIEFKCPKCGSENFDYYDTDFDIAEGIHWDLCSCDKCSALFRIRYVAVEIESN